MVRVALIAVSQPAIQVSAIGDKSKLLWLAANATADVEKQMALPKN